MIMTEERRVRREQLDPDRVLDLLRASDLVGHGGGGFPTATKIESVRRQRPELIVNGCDGEPLVHKDSVLLSHRPLLVADGIAVLQRLVRPRRTMIAVHAGPAEAAAATVIGAGGIVAEILRVPDRYVASEASALANLAGGGVARPRYREHPLTAGTPGRRRPTLVLNAETVARIAAIVVSGGATPTRLLTLAGDVRLPGVLEVPFGTRIGDLIAGAGPADRPRAVLVGGYGGRWFGWDDLAGRTVADLAGSGRNGVIGAGLIMVHARGCPLRLVGTILGYLAEASAGQCGPCMFGLPAIAADWRQLTNPGTSGAAAERLRRRLPTIAGRGACHHPDGAVAMAATALGVFGSDLEAHRGGRCTGHVLASGVTAGVAAGGR